jgi:hypothetical protein
MKYDGGRAQHPQPALSPLPVYSDKSQDGKHEAAVQVFSGRTSTAGKEGETCEDSILTQSKLPPPHFKLLP